MELYTDEKISHMTFAKGKVIDDLLEQTEALFTEHFGTSYFLLCEDYTQGRTRRYQKG